MDKENISYEILGVWSDYPNIYSDKLNDCVSTNYYHYGVSVGDMVYDNVTLTGMEYHYWKMDMGGETLIKIKNVDEINPQKFRKEMMNRNE